MATGILFFLALVLMFVCRGGLSKRRRQAPGFWRRLLVWQLCLLPVHLFVLVPGFIGFAGSRLVQTRGDEMAYRGPVFDEQGSWRLQTRDTLRADGPLEPRSRVDIEKRTVHFTNSVGRRLRGFYVKCRDREPSAVAVMVHGLFRNSMELEPVAAMFRDSDADVLLLELSNHGGSDNHPFTFGDSEREDVLAAVEFLRRRDGGIGAPLILYGVSLGCVAVALAAPEIDELRGIVLEAPMTTLLDVAHRQLGRFLHFPRPYSSLVLWYVECWSGFDMGEVRPIDSYKLLPKTLPSLFIGAGLDRLVPPKAVREGFDALQAPPGRKDLWIEENVRHGQVSAADPPQYLARLQKLLKRVTQ